jgi:hypothetical protein
MAPSEGAAQSVGSGSDALASDAPSPRVLAEVGLTSDDVDAMNAHERPLGYGSTEQWQQSQGELYQALDQSGLSDAAVQLQGDSTSLLTGRPFPKTEDEFVAQAARAGIAEDTARQMWQASAFSSVDPSTLPEQHFFDSQYRLGLDGQPSGYQFAIASDAVPHEDGWEKFLGDWFPLLKAWAERWTELTGRLHTIVQAAGTGPIAWPLNRPPDTN